MAWCHQATSHYLSQCWPISLLQYGVTRPQWVNKGLSTPRSMVFISKPAPALLKSSRRTSVLCSSHELWCQPINHAPFNSRINKTSILFPWKDKISCAEIYLAVYYDHFEIVPCVCITEVRALFQYLFGYIDSHVKDKTVMRPSYFYIDTPFRWDVFAEACI